MYRNVTICVRWSSSLPEFIEVRISSFALFTVPHKWKELPLYLAFSALYLHPTNALLPASPFVVSSCSVIGCPTFRTKMSQGPAKCSTVTRPIFAEWHEWVWCTRLACYCIIGCLKLIALELNTFNDPCPFSVPPPPCVPPDPVD